MIYKAVLTSEEVQKFMSNFFESENCHTTSVCVKPARGVAETHAVVLEPDGAIAYGTLRASFADGILFEDGWHEKFEPVDQEELETLLTVRGRYRLCSALAEGSRAGLLIGAKGFMQSDDVMADSLAVKTLKSDGGDLVSSMHFTNLVAIAEEAAKLVAA